MRKRLFGLTAAAGLMLSCAAVLTVFAFVAAANEYEMIDTCVERAVNCLPFG